MASRLLPHAPQGHILDDLYAIFAATAGDAAVEVASEDDLIERFNLATLLGRVGRRSVRAMWVVDNASNQVVRVHGAVPGAIAGRTTEDIGKKPPAPSLSLERAPGRRTRRS